MFVFLKLVLLCFVVCCLESASCVFDDCEGLVGKAVSLWDSNKERPCLMMRKPLIVMGIDAQKRRTIFMMTCSSPPHHKKSKISCHCISTSALYCIHHVVRIPNSLSYNPFSHSNCTKMQFLPSMKKCSMYILKILSTNPITAVHPQTHQKLLNLYSNQYQNFKS